MRFLVVGAGALGGYFGGRLLEAGEDVTFLLRPRRAAQLAKTGLVMRSPRGDLTLPSPPSVQAERVDGHYDVVIVGCKAYDLAETMNSFAPAVGPNTAILPLLNGMRHLDELAERFGREHVLGGLCMISAVLDDAGSVLHLNDVHGLDLWRTRRFALAAHAGVERGVRQGPLRRRRLRHHSSGHVGEVGAHRIGRQHDLPDARHGR